MEDVLARIESALQRAEVAAERLARRHSDLRGAAHDTLAGLDRLLQPGQPVGDGRVADSRIVGMRRDG